MAETRGGEGMQNKHVFNHRQDERKVTLKWKPGHIVSTSMLRGIDYNPNGWHLKPQASKEIKVHNGVKKHKNTYLQANISLYFISGSCGYSFRDRQGNLASPNYPYSYPNNLKCSWTITARPGDYIYLYFTYFYVQGYYYWYSSGAYGNYGYNSYCPYDYVEIFDLNYPSSSIIVRGCGYQSPWCVKSNSHVVHIRFVTNSIYSYPGFTARYAVYTTPTAGDNCLSLHPNASSLTLLQSTPST